MELLEAEARDSEEETEDPGTELFGHRSTSLPRLQGDISVATGSHIYSPNKMSTIHQGSSAANPPHDVESNLLPNRRSPTPCRETGIEEVTYKQDPGEFYKKDLDCMIEIGHQEVAGPAKKSGCQNQDAIQNGEFSTTPDMNLQVESNALSSDAPTAKMGSTSSKLCYSKRIPKMEVTREEQSNLHWEDLNDIISNVDADMSRVESRTNCIPHCYQSPTVGSKLAPKRKVSNSNIGSKSLRLEGQGLKIPPKSPSTEAGYAQLQPISATSIINGRTDTSGPLEERAKASSNSSKHVASSRFTSLSYKKRSLKREQSTSETKISRNNDCPSVLSAQNCKLKGESDQPVGINVESVETNVSDLVISPNGMVEPKRALDLDGSLKKTDPHLDSLVIDDTSRDGQPLTEKACKTFSCSRECESVTRSGDAGDNVMEDASKFISNITDQPQGRQLDGEAANPHDRDFETRKLSNTASTVTPKENTVNESSGMRMKKVVSRRNLSCKPKPTMINASMDEDLDTSNKATTTPRRPEGISANVEKAKVEIELKKVANNEKKEIKKSVPKDAVMKNKAALKLNTSPERCSRKKPLVQMDICVDPEKENKQEENGCVVSNVDSHPKGEILFEGSKSSRQVIEKVTPVKKGGDKVISCAKPVNPEPVWFILSGHRFQKKEFQAVIRRLRGRVCRDSHSWSYQATHFIVPDPVRRTEKFFAAAAAGRYATDMA